MNIRHGNRVAAVLLVMMLGACAATPEAPRERDADAKHFESVPGSAVIYLYRADVSGGLSTLWLNNRLLGQTLAQTYFRATARADRSVIATSGADNGRIELETREEGVYFVEMRVYGQGEGDSQTIFRRVTPEIGRQAILRCCNLLENWRPGQSRLSLFGM